MAFDEKMVVRMIKAHEGCSLRAYPDTRGCMTIGWGHLMGHKDPDKITLEQANALFEDDFRIAKHTASGFDAYQSLSPNRQAVLVDMSYNLGQKKLSKFKNFMKNLEKGDFQMASMSMISSAWFCQVKGRGVTLVKMMLFDLTYDDAINLEV